jgi:phage shock protein PspC (stress-responsive transcriptional regulator)
MHTCTLTLWVRSLRWDMKGRVLDFSIADGSGAISGDDGVRYRFVGSEWKSAGKLPNTGARVDFVATEDVASAVYLDPGSRASSAVLDDDRYNSLYCSSDERIILGLCGGLAHKFDVPVAAVRFAVFLSLFVVIGWLYFVGLFLPKLPTKDVPRPE